MPTNQIITSLANINWPEFNPSSQTANMTYVVTTNKTLSTNITLAENITLIFAGGRILGSGKTLTGNNTFLIAPITQIFGSDLNIDGSWIMDRAYPQWFGANNKATSTTSTSLDSATAINKAIILKRVGEVFIPRGEYVIGSSIILKHGIILCGEKARASTQLNQQNTSVNMGTVIRPLNNGNFTGSFMILVNTLGSDPASATWVESYPDTHTAIKDIYFSNSINTVKNLKGVLSAGAIEFDSCRWYNFAQAVATAQRCYSDGKIITNCICSNDATIHDELDAFDLRGLGDNLCFKGNHLTGLKKGLYLRECNGGEICRNILNANVTIDSCKGITLSSNHFEGDSTQLSINQSAVEIANNFFEKGSVPNLRITGSSYYDISVITLINNIFLYYDNENEVGNPFDIQTDEQVSMKIINSYRAWIDRSNAAKMYFYGLALCRTDGTTPILEFNNHSYFLSSDSLIKPITPNSSAFKTGIIRNQSVLTGSITMYGMVSGGTHWAEELFGSSYYYWFQVVWDQTRGIVTNKTAINNQVSGYSFTPVRNSAGYISGVLLTISDGSYLGHQVTIRLIRSTNSTGTANVRYVDIPICGARYLYDNGNSICDFRWTSVGSVLTKSIDPIGAIEFSGQNIICRSTSMPTNGNWTNGDIVYNMGTGTNALWIRSNNIWLSK